MLKKILAASTAGVLAMTALASTAMADEQYDIVIENFEKLITVEFEAELNATEIEQLIGNTGTSTTPVVEADKTYLLSKDDDTKNSYNNIALSIWADPAVKIGAGINFDGATVDFKLQGQLKDQYLIQNGTASFDPDAAPTTAFVTTTPDFANVAATGLATRPSGAVDIKPNFDTDHIAVTDGGGLVADLGQKGGPAGYIINKNTGALLGWTDKNPAKGQYDKDYSKEYTIAAGSSWYDSKLAQAGKVSTPVKINAEFGLNATSTLQGIDFDDSRVKVNFTMTGTETAWGSVLNATHISDDWQWDNATWTNLMDILNSQSGSDYISQKFGIVGESGVVIGGLYTRKAGMSQKKDVKIVKKSDEPKNVPLPMTASVPIGVGQNATIPTLQKMNNGGKMKFHFDKDLSSAIIVGTVIFYGTSGQVALPVGSDYAWEDNGKTLVMDFPANLTYDPSMNNKYNSFKASYNLVCNTVTGVVGTDTAGNTNFAGSDQYGTNHLMKITFTANAEKPADGGLVNPGNSDSTPSTSTPSNNSGSTNKGDETNPGTGVAVAVAPVVLAAAGAAVVISKKRK